MRTLLIKRRFYLLIAATLIFLAVVLLLKLKNSSGPELITTTIERGDVAEIVSVSGFVEAQNAAELAFPITGIVDKVLVDKILIKHVAQNSKKLIMPEEHFYHQDSPHSHKTAVKRLSLRP